MMRTHGSGRRSQRQRGFSLVELMVAVTIGAMLVGAALAATLMSRQIGGVNSAVSMMQANARFALATLERDLRMTGYRGCLGGWNRRANQPTQVDTTLSNPTAYDRNYNVSLQGFEFRGGAWAPLLDASIAGVAPPPLGNAGDVVTLRTATGPEVPLSMAMVSQAVPVPVATTAPFWDGQVVMISDCVRATTFEISNIAAGQLLHTPPRNTTPLLGRTYGTDASVVGMTTVTYFVGRSTLAPNGNELSLWRIDSQRAALGIAQPEEVIDNVEGFRVLYGEDLDADQVPDRYVSAGDVTDMTNVVAVQLNLLLRSPNDGVAMAVGAPITFNGSVTPATDRRLRRAFSATVTLRNRVL
ncbi:MAG TPA: PilW family protein [Burkholderiaceae bacterium]|nr:PilW family protein [Burkholderiaceae bacterium]